MQATKPNVAELVGRLPDADTPGKTDKFTGPAPDAAEKVFDEILAGGRESILELIGLVVPTTEQGFKDFRPEYALHCLAVYVGRPGKEAQRAMYVDALASRIADAGTPKALRGVLVRQLQVAGGKEAVGAIGKHLLDDDLCETAAQALIAIREGAAAELRKALPGAKGKSRVTIVQALGVVRDAEAVAGLKEALGDESREARIAAAWALANIGDAASVEQVLKAADSKEGWERIQCTKACLVLAERLLAAGNKEAAVRVYSHLRDTRKGTDEKYVSEAAEIGLAKAG